MGRPVLRLSLPGGVLPARKASVAFVFLLLQMDRQIVQL
jgi:hypothetical protein